MVYLYQLRLKASLLIRGITLIPIPYILLLAAGIALVLMRYTLVVKPYHSPILLAVSIYALHAYRKDKHLLQRFLAHLLPLFWIEYGLLSIPLLTLSLCKEFYTDLLLYPVIILTLPLTARYKARRLRLSNPLLRAGSYEYQLAFGQLYPISFVLYVLAGVAVYYQNINLLYVAGGIHSLIYCLPLLMPEPLYYTSMYRSLGSLWRHKLLSILHNTLVLFVPLLVASAIAGLHTLGVMLLIAAGTCLLSAQALLVRYSLSGAIILSSLLFLFYLIPSTVLTMVEPLFSPILVANLIFLISKSHHKLSKLFTYAHSKPLE